MTLHGDMSVCIGLTVQCSPMASTAVRTSSAAPPYIGGAGNPRRHRTPRCGAGAINPTGVGSCRPTQPTGLVSVHSADDVPDYDRRRVGGGGGRRMLLDEWADASNYRHQNRRSHPPAAVLDQSRPQQRLHGRGFRTPQVTDDPTASTDWKTRGRPSYDDIPVVTPFHDDPATTSVFENHGRDLREQSGGELLDDDVEEMAFDEITQQIASLTQTVNELRCKNRRPVTHRQWRI